MEYKDVTGAPIEVGSMLVIIHNKEIAFAKVARLSKSGSKYESNNPTVYAKRAYRKVKMVPVKRPWGTEIVRQVNWVTEGTPQLVRDHESAALVVDPLTIPTAAYELLK